LRFYTVNSNYITYLKTHDGQVPDNYTGKRPYIGIVLEVNGHNYIAPLTSYKEKQEQLRPSNPTIFKLHEKNNPSNKLGMVHLNNMIPVIETEINGICFDDQVDSYKNLLTLQLAFIKENQEHIKKKANNLHKHVTQSQNFPLKRICCDFLLLEAKYRDFK
jgi:protein AbiQ